jgi:hypothetical protein
VLTLPALRDGIAQTFVYLVNAFAGVLCAAIMNAFPSDKRPTVSFSGIWRSLAPGATSPCSDSARIQCNSAAVDESGGTIIQ